MGGSTEFEKRGIRQGVWMTEVLLCAVKGQNPSKALGDEVLGFGGRSPHKLHTTETYSGRKQDSIVHLALLLGSFMH